MNLSVNSARLDVVRRLLIRAITCSIFLLLPSCAIPGLRRPDPAPDVPHNYSGTATTDNSALLGIDEFFQDPFLTRLIDLALLGNRELKGLDEEVRIARNEVLARQGSYLPFIGFGASGGIEKPSEFTPIGQAEKQLEYAPGKHFPDPLPNMMGTINIFWALDIWRELRNGRDAAIQRYYSAAERRNTFVNRMIAEVAENYYRVMALDARLQTLDATILLQQRSLELSKAKKDAGRGTELAVQRFQAEVRKNQSEKLIVDQEIIVAENRINFLANRFPQAVERISSNFFELTIHSLSVGVPAQLLENRPDIRQAEREIAANGLDILVARAHFYPRLDITASVGYQAFNPRYLFNTPEALIANAAVNLAVPLFNRKAIQAEYMTTNARQLQSIYEYQRVILTAFTEVINMMAAVENYRQSIEIKKQQLASLEASVDTATKLFQNARAEYVEVLLAQRDLQEAKMVLIDTKREQLAATVKAYQALGGGGNLLSVSDQGLPHGGLHHHAD
ncbi:N/A [soil metagenome]